MEEKSKIVDIKPKTKEFRNKILKVIGNKKLSAYDIAKTLQEDYKRVLYHLKVMEFRGQVKFAGEEASEGYLPKRLYRRGKK